MTQDVTGRAGWPRMAPASPADTQERRARYLQALAGLSAHHAHDVRGRLGAVALHLDLAAELLGSGTATAPAAIGRARGEIERASAGLHHSLDAIDALVGLTRPSPPEVQRLDVADLVHDLEATLAPAMRDRKIEWHPPQASALVTGDRDALREALLIAAYEILAGLAPGSRLELAVTLGGDRVELAITGVPAIGEPVADAGAAPLPGGGDPMQIVRATIESYGGEARHEGAARLILALPFAARSG